MSSSGAVEDERLVRGGDSLTASSAPPKKNEYVENLDINNDVVSFFIGVANYEKHLEAQEMNLKRYASAIVLLLRNGVELSSNSRVRALAAAWASRNYDLADCLLTIRDAFGLPEVVKALSILDADRMVRVWERKMKQAEVGAAVSGGRVKRRTISRAKNNIDNIRTLRSAKGRGANLSGALARRLKKWVRTFSAKELEFFALHYPPDLWRRLADVVHLHPEKDFPTVPWFLNYCFTGNAPEGSYIHRAKLINTSNVNEIVAQAPVPFSVVRHLVASLTKESMVAIARAGDRVDRAIWWYEELSCPEVDQVIVERLDAGEEVQFNYGKLMERLLTFSLWGEDLRPPFLPRLIHFAETKLRATRLSIDSPIAVLADASFSMTVAIRTATIISSLLSAFTSAKLVFFNDNFWIPDEVPRTIEDVLSLSVSTKAERSTAHAAGLWPFYKRREAIKTFIIVTDEEENSPYEDFKFLDLYEAYCREVFESRLVFISFLETQTDRGAMVTELRGAGHKPLQFRMDRHRPDLTKLDSILGQLATGCADFETELQKVEETMESQGMKAVFVEAAKKIETNQCEEMKLK